MIENTFCHIPRISVRRETDLWNSGLHSWRDLLEADSLPVSRKMKDHLSKHIECSVENMQKSDAHYFAVGLPTKEHWRLFPDFRHSIAYIDIETTGMDPWNHTITSIALYDGREIHTYVQGENLPEFKRDIRQYKVIVSYNGKCFDVPFLQNYFQFQMNHVHIDLRYVLKSLGYSGGLKSCERQMGISRHELEGVSGAFAVLLWREYERTQNLRALETLLAYNIQDVLSLEVLLAEAYNLKILDTPFKVSHRLPIPVSPTIPYSPDVEMIERLKEENQWAWE